MREDKPKTLKDLKRSGNTLTTVTLQGNAPHDLGDVKAIRREMARVYRFIWQKKISIDDAVRLVACLDKMVQAVKSEAEMATLQNAYLEAWSGVNITPPAGGAPLLAPSPQAEILGPVEEEEKNEE